MTVHQLQPEPEPDPFTEFWQLCPKKCGKPLAAAKFYAITNGGLETRTLDRDSNTYVSISLQATPEELIEGMARYRRSMTNPAKTGGEWKDDGKYLINPATFLNQGRWMDG